MALHSAEPDKTAMEALTSHLDRTTTADPEGPPLANLLAAQAFADLAVLSWVFPNVREWQATRGEFVAVFAGEDGALVFDVNVFNGVLPARLRKAV
jgi:hypothetical protein